MREQVDSNREEMVYVIGDTSGLYLFMLAGMGNLFNDLSAIYGTMRMHSSKIW